MIPWKSRLYAFVLKRALGPLLDTKSLEQLHRSIQISISDGKLQLEDVALNLQYLKRIHNAPSISIRKAKVGRLEVTLTIQEENEENQSSLAWRVMELGSATGGARVSLVARIQLDGVLIEIEPNSHPLAQPVSKIEPLTDVTEQESPKSIVASYLEAALAALRLSVFLNDIQIMIACEKGIEEESSESWLKIHLQSLSYQDQRITPNKEATGESTQVMHKSLTIGKVTLITGENVINVNGEISKTVVSTKVALVEGTTKVQLHLFAYSDHDAKSEPKYQQEIQIQMSQHFHLFVDQKSISRLLGLVEIYGRHVVAEAEIAHFGADSECTSLKDDGKDAINEDLETLNGIMEQFNEARKMAEDRFVRGGLLLPSVDDGEVTYDAFFDANDQSLISYANVLNASILASKNERDEDGSTHIHTKIRATISGGSLKVSFGTPSSLNECSRTSLSEEYILISMSDISISAAASSVSMEVAASWNRVEIEDAVLRLQESAVPRSEVRSILRFVSQIESQRDALLEAPCISFSLQKKMNEFRVEVILEAVEASFDATTTLNLLNLLSSLPEAYTGAAMDDNPVPIALQAIVACPSVCARIPIDSDRDVSNLFSRCGQTISIGDWQATKYLEVLIESLSLESQSESSEEPSSVSFECQSVAVSALDAEKEISLKRFPIICMAGRAEVNPVIPVAIKLYSGCQEAVGRMSRESFPQVKALTSFKARQEDEDDEAHIDSLLKTDIKGLDIGGRKELRTQDPQPEMLVNAEGCTSVVTISVPGLVGDLSGDELVDLLALLECAQSSFRQTRTLGAEPVVDASIDQPWTGISLSIDRLSLCLHEVDCNASCNSLCFESSHLKAHVVQNISGLGQVRLMVQEFDLYEVEELGCTKDGEVLEPADAILARSLFCSPNDSFRPFFHRSHLFTPISKESPVFVMDVISQEAGTQLKVHTTCYDLTYRFNYESDWIAIIHRTVKKVALLPASPQSDAVEEGAGKIVRIFFTLADCNVDYQSSSHFSTPSRTILRLGDVRLSSNLVFPLASVQAISVGFGDLSMYLCSTRFGYEFEDSCTIAARRRHPTEKRKALAEDVLAKMNYRSVLTLDNADAVAIFSRLVDNGEPMVRLSITAGSFSMFACKDSFAVLVATIGELVDNMTVLNDEALNSLRERNRYRVSHSHSQVEHQSTHPQIHSFPRIERAVASDRGFLLDGYDWTTIDAEQSSSTESLAPGEEQAAKWYDRESIDSRGLDFITHHFPMNPETDPLLNGDMGASKLIGTMSPPAVDFRVLVLNLDVKLRLFDGYDWPELLDEEETKLPCNPSFVIRQHSVIEGKPGETIKGKIQPTTSDRKAALMGNLLHQPGGIETDTFIDAPLPEEKAKRIQLSSTLSKLKRRTDRYIQFNLKGISARIDSMKESPEHLLSSCLHLQAQDFFLAETISNSKPVKMVGEWFSELEHPRDTNDGLFLVKLVTWKPEIRVHQDNSIASDITEGVLRILPLRCFMDQGAMFFIREFFHTNDPKTYEMDYGYYRLPPPLVRSFHVKPFKVKVNYTPQRLDRKALREGAFVELANLSPIDDMILVMKELKVPNKIGFGEGASFLVSSWIADIVRHQLVKFVTNVRPLEPITQVGETAVDMVALPWEAFRNGESVQRAIRSGTYSFASTVACEFLEVGSRMTELLASALGRGPREAFDRSYLPSRPLDTPRGVLDTTHHAVESMARGVQAANYKIVIIPYREYQRSGAGGAVRSVLRGVPVAISAPTGAAAEAISYSLLGVRNQIRPDIRREEEAVQRGLRHEEG